MTHWKRWSAPNSNGLIAKELFTTAGLLFQRSKCRKRSLTWGVAIIALVTTTKRHYGNFPTKSISIAKSITALALFEDDYKWETRNVFRLHQGLRCRFARRYVLSSFWLENSGYDLRLTWACSPNFARKIGRVLLLWSPVEIWDPRSAHVTSWREKFELSG